MFHEWWSEQTSPRLFLAFIVLYVIQIINLLLYWNCPFFGHGTLENVSSTPVEQQPIFHGPLQEHAQATLNKLHGQDIPFKPEVQSSEILSPLVLMMILTILHSQIVATNSSSCGKVRNSYGDQRIRKNGSGGITGSKYRSKRRLSRHHPRRKSNTTLSKSPSKVASAIPNAVAGTSKACIPCGTSAQGATNKKVLFEDGSKSSSNSDKDEGIAEEYINHDSAENDNDPKPYINNIADGSSGCESQKLDISDKIIEANVVATLKGLLDVADANTNGCGNELKVPLCKHSNSTCRDHISSPEASPVPEKKSNLRKRNLSKLSEVSTTSFSCADCSSNNNDTSSDEERDETVIDEDDIPSKSEWTAVTTNSEDEDYGEDMHSDDDDDEKNDHPFAWEFEKVFQNSLRDSYSMRLPLKILI